MASDLELTEAQRVALAYYATDRPPNTKVQASTLRALVSRGLVNSKSPIGSHPSVTMTQKGYRTHREAILAKKAKPFFPPGTRRIEIEGFPLRAKALFSRGKEGGKGRRWVVWTPDGKVIAPPGAELPTLAHAIEWVKNHRLEQLAARHEAT